MDVTPTDVAKVVGVCPVIDVGMVRQQDNLYQVLFMVLHVYVAWVDFLTLWILFLLDTLGSVIPLGASNMYP